MVWMALAWAGPRIVGGEPTVDGQHPGVVSIRLVGASSSICTGSVIAPDAVLTAAHCFDGAPTEVSVGIGVDADSPERRVQAASWEVHEGYVRLEDSASGEPENDVALIRLAEPAEVAPIPLNPDPLDGSWVGWPLTFVGYGVTAFQASDSGTQRFAEAPISAVETDLLRTEDSALGGTCQGDSGGPGLSRDGEGWIQLAITSFGVGCGAGDAGHVRVDRVLPWITARVPNVLTQPASAPSFVCDNLLDPEDPASIALGPTPLQTVCVADVSASLGLLSTTWTWGDGERDVVDGLTASHTYTATGAYTVSACFEGDAGGSPWRHCVSRPAYVHACGAPEVSFEVGAGPGLTLEIDNATPLRTPTCVTDATWSVFEGDTARGEPVLQASGWSPELIVPRPGRYTVVLDAAGPGGQGAGQATVDVGGALGCASTPGVAGLPGLLGIALIRRRKVRATRAGGESSSYAAQPDPSRGPARGPNALEDGCTR